MTVEIQKQKICTWSTELLKLLRHCLIFWHCITHAV